MLLIKGGRAGEEIQYLSRFVGAQRLAFHKLLKKYRKWTGSSELGSRFRKEILERPTSFSKTDFEPLLAQWTEVLASVRAPFINGINLQSGPTQNSEGECRSPQLIPHKSPGGSAQNQVARGQHAIENLSSAVVPQAVWEDGSTLEKDAALATIPFGRSSAKAAYWIHPDNIVQIHVLLLQYTRLQKSNDTIPSPEHPASPRGSIGSHSAKCSPRTDEDLGVIICDDLERFAQKQSSETISDSENRAGLAPEKAAASIRYTSNGDAVVVLGATTKDDGECVDSGRDLCARKARVKRKAVQRLFSTSGGDPGAITDKSNDFERTRQWLVGHKEVQPLVQLQLRRTRFVGLKNSVTNGLWATLDKDISLRRCSAELLADDQGFEMINDGGKRDSERFPHAVLEIRTEGLADAGVMAVLDASYLVRLSDLICSLLLTWAADRKGTRLFSRETCRGNPVQASRHATTVLGGCSSIMLSDVLIEDQLPALKEDIRKVPSTSTAPKARRWQGPAGPEESSTRHTSISASSTRNGVSSSGFSALRGESSATSAPDTLATPALGAYKKKQRRRSNRKQMLQRPQQGPAPARQERYWNEFDDGSEGSQDEVYTVLVDPNASYGIPGAAAVSKLFESFSSTIMVVEEKTLHWLKSFQETRHGEQRPLIHGQCSPGTAESDQSDVESSRRIVRRSPRRHYSTFRASSQPAAVRAREALLFRSCLASFAGSFILLLVAAILVTTGRRKAASTVDAGVVIGVVSSLVFAIMGVGSMMRRRDDVGWVHRTVVSLIFIGVLLASSFLLLALWHTG